jgi:hypothetical protein
MGALLEINAEAAPKPRSRQGGTPPTPADKGDLNQLIRYIHRPFHRIQRYSKYFTEDLEWEAAQGRQHSPVVRQFALKSFDDFYPRIDF